MLNRLRDVFASLSSHEVRYIVIGGIAAVLYGVPRATFDLDILVDATPINAGALLAALRDAKFGTADLITPEELLAHEITIFKDRCRIDVQTRTPGLSFEEAWNRRVAMKAGGEVFWAAAKEDIIRSKKAAGRPIDLEDARLLESGDQGYSQ